MARNLSSTDSSPRKWRRQYYKLDAMLLNEIQKLAKAHAADQAEIARLQSQVAAQLKQGREQQVHLHDCP